jgi:hypothetical protein
VRDEEEDSPLAWSLRSLGARVSPRLDGYDFVLRGVAGSYTLGEVDDHDDGPATHCRVPLPEGAPRFAMELRARTAEAQRALDRGDAIEVPLGDEAFDRSFVVEAAPADVIRALIDETTRAALLALAPCRFALDAGALHLSKPGTRTSKMIVAQVVGLCVDVHERVERLPLEMARLREPAGYRGTTPAEAAARPEEAARAAAEIEAVEDARRTRRQAQGMKAGVAIVATVVVGTTLLEWLVRC